MRGEAEEPAETKEAKGLTVSNVTRSQAASEKPGLRSGNIGR